MLHFQLIYICPEMEGISALNHYVLFSQFPPSLFSFSHSLSGTFIPPLTHHAPFLSLPLSLSLSLSLSLALSLENPINLRQWF